MNIKQIITDYIMKSILETRGDMVVRGLAIPEKLVGVALGQVLKSGGVGALPAWGKPSLLGMNMTSGSFTRNTVGAEIVSGLGFTPVLIFFLSSDSTISNANISIGIDNGAALCCVCINFDGSQSLGDSTSSIYIKRDGTNYIYGTVTALVAGGFTVTFVLELVCSVNVRWFAIG